MSLFSKTYSARVEIGAPAEKVWSVLTNLDQYHAWNPFTVRVQTDWQPGSRVVLTVQMHASRKPIRQVEYITRLVPGRELAWGMDWGIWLKAERVQRITEMSPGLVRYETVDHIHGLLCPIVHILYGRSIQDGFERMAVSLKKYIKEV